MPLIQMMYSVFELRVSMSPAQSESTAAMSECWLKGFYGYVVVCLMVTDKYRRARLERCAFGEVHVTICWSVHLADENSNWEEEV